MQKLSKKLFNLCEKALEGKIMKNVKFVPYEKLSLLEKVEFHQNKGDLIEWLEKQGVK